MNEIKDFIAGINELRKKKNAIILAHYYQDKHIQDIADFKGDSLALATEAAKTNADIIVFAGVVFMAETAKIICPDKKVLIPDVEASCSLVEQCPTESFKNFIDQYPDHVVVTYINSSAEVKGMSDVIVTSSNAVAIVESFPKSQKIIFGPDKNLGRYLQEKTGRDLVLWDGSCLVHENFSAEKILKLKELHPDAKIIAHPECAHIVLEIAEFIGSTNALLNYAKKDKAEKFIVVTEAGIIHEMEKQMPYKKFIPAPPGYFTNCNCGECPYMKMNTLEKIYSCLEKEAPEAIIEESIRIKAEKAIRKMFSVNRDQLSVINDQLSMIIEQ